MVDAPSPTEMDRQLKSMAGQMLRDDGSDPESSRKLSIEFERVLIARYQSFIRLPDISHVLNPLRREL